MITRDEVKAVPYIQTDVLRFGGKTRLMACGQDRAAGYDLVKNTFFLNFNQSYNGWRLNNQVRM